MMPRSGADNPKIAEIIFDYREKHKTNADRIRAMSDEEMAENIFHHISNWSCPPRKEFIKASCGGNPNCTKCWFEWLQSPAGGDGDD